VIWFEVTGLLCLRCYSLKSKPERNLCTLRVGVRIWCKRLNFGSVLGELVVGCRVLGFVFLLYFSPISKNRKYAWERESRKGVFSFWNSRERTKRGRHVCWIEEHTEARFLDPRVAYEALIGLICPSHDAPFHNYMTFVWFELWFDQVRWTYILENQSIFFIKIILFLFKKNSS
jgi:hypothetical protein